MLNVIREQFAGAVESFHIMAVPASIFTALMTYTGGHAEAFITWCILSSFDLVFGVILAIVKKKFDARKLYHWVGRVCVQLLSIVIFAAILRMLHIAAGIELVFANWLLFFYALMDFTSIMDKLLILGFMPRPAYMLLKFLRRRSAKVFAAAMNEEGMADELEAALKRSKDVKKPRKGVPA